ncbi:MAG: FtsX-like permease family protein [Acetobacteraceae bacterium]|nr:FtsX-like permease family protein [Acetobacteraceae bacterium]
MILALRFARRELRGGVRGLRIVLACLALGVAIIAGVGSLREAIDRGLAENGQQLLGGDLSIETGAQPLPAEVREWLAGKGARLSAIVLMRSILVAPSSERQLIELKAVDEAWPLVGEAVLDPPQAIGAALAARDGRPGIVAQQIVLDRLRLRQGDQVRLGNASFVVRGVLAAEPDRVAGAAALAPRAIISMDALPATGLVVPGSIVEHAVRAVLPPGTPAASVARELGTAFPNTGWRIREARDAAPGVSRFIDRTGLFMTLVGLTALLVGGIGAANGVRAWLEARATTIATLRSLGASARLVFAVCFLQVLALAFAGVVIGLAAGALLPLVAIFFFRDLMPVVPDVGVYPGPLLLAAGFGLLTAGAFVLWPLGRAARIPGAALFRDTILPDHVRPGRWLIVANLVLVALLVGLTVLASSDRVFAAWFSAAALLTLGLFRLGGWALMAAARGAPRLNAPWARLGLSNLHRPGAATPLMLVSVGLGLSTLAAVALIQGNIRHELAEQMPTNAPSFYFVDIQDDQLPEFEDLVRGQVGTSDLQHVPSLRARIVAVNGVRAEEVKATPDTRWGLRGDRGLTYAATPPEGTRIVAGAWWSSDYHGPPLVSLDAGLAKGWGVGLGDTIRVNVLGRDIDLRVASLRDIAWRSLALNFIMVASPGLLEHAPHTHIATVRATSGAQGSLLRAVTDALPNVTGIPVGEVLKAVADLLDKIAAALAATGSLTLVAGALVLAGAVAAGQRRRIHEAVILKALGATRRQIRAAWLVEFGVLGVAAGLVAASVGTAASYGVVRFVMDADWVFLPSTLGATLLACVVLMLGFGYVGTSAALRAAAAPLLRNE